MRLNPSLERVGHFLSDLPDFIVQILRTGLDNPVSLILDNRIQRGGDALCGLTCNLRDNVPDNILRDDRSHDHLFHLGNLAVSLVALVGGAMHSEERKHDPDDEGEAGEIESELEHG